jgi:branched-chain amino acid aminotransferase
MIPNSKTVSHSRTWTFSQSQWHEGNVLIMGPRTHGLWLGSTVFDGARAFEGVTPDLDRHCARVNQSAINFGLKPMVDLDTWLGLAREGIARFPANAELYIGPMYWPQNGIGGGVLYDPETTDWCLCIYEAPIPKPVGSAITLSPFRRPTVEWAPVAAGRLPRTYGCSLPAVRTDRATSRRSVGRGDGWQHSLEVLVGLAYWNWSAPVLLNPKIRRCDPDLQDFG